MQITVSHKIYLLKSPSFILDSTSLDFNSMKIFDKIRKSSLIQHQYHWTWHSNELFYFDLTIYSDIKFFYLVSYLIFRWYSWFKWNKAFWHFLEGGVSFCFESCASSCSWGLLFLIFSKCYLLKSKEESQNFNSLIKVFE